MKHFFTLIFSIAMCVATAQQVEEFNLVRENAIALNPALAGASGFMNITAGFRRQFTAIKNSPYTTYLNFNTQLADNHFCIGVSGVYDATGPTSKAGATLQLAYQVNLNRKVKEAYHDKNSHFISFALQASVYQYRLDGSKLLVNDYGDPELTFANATKVFPDAGFGIYYQYKNYLNVGVSVPNLVMLDVNYKSATTDVRLLKIPHLYFVAAGSYAIAPDKFWIEPVLSFRWVKNAPLQTVAGVRLSFIKWFWIGFNYRTANAVNMEAGVTIKDKLRIGYVYDFILEAYRPDIGQTHEIGVQVFFNKANVKRKGYFPGMSKGKNF